VLVVLAEDDVKCEAATEDEDRIPGVRVIDAIEPEAAVAEWEHADPILVAREPRT